jgi:LuxR family maltose regulon positive regulatory protein
VLRTKLRPPVHGHEYVARRRLHTALDDAARSPLTLVVAPAGSGKTSLLSAWSTGRRRAWLSLDETDRDVVQLWADVIAALETVVPGCGTRASGVLGRPGTVREAIDVLLDDLEETPPEPAVLVIDDAQAVAGASDVAATTALFVSHLPPWLRVMMASRTAPEIPLARLRAHGGVSELHYSELQFDDAESRGLLRAVAPRLPEDRLAGLAEWSQGWAAGLQLAALTARVAAAAANGTDPWSDERSVAMVTDFLWNDVLAAEDPDVVEVLLATAVVERIDPELARRLTGRDDASRLLERARARGLFVSPLEAEGFEVHGIVRDVLRAELARRGRLADQHVLAAECFVERDQVAQGLEHWLAADRPREALRLLASRCAQLYDAGREATIRRALARIPAAVTGGDPRATLELAWCHLLVDRERFHELSDGLEAWAKDAPGVPDDLRRQLDMVGAIAATTRGAWGSGAATAARTASALGPAWWIDPLGRFAWNMVARDVALSGRWDDDSGEVRRVARALSLDRERSVAFEGTRSLGLALAGRPVDALRVAAGLRDSAAFAEMTILRTEVSTAEALARLEVGERETAVQLLREVVETPPGPVAYAPLLALLALAEASSGSGDHTRAGTELGAASELVARELPGPDARSLLATTAVRVALGAGDVDAAAGWTTRIIDPFWRAIADTRLLIAHGRPEEAREVLAAARPVSDRHRVVHGLLTHRVATDPVDQAPLLAALELAVSRAMLQTVAAEGPEILAAVEAAAWRVPAPWLERLRAAGRPQPGPEDGPPLTRWEPLTDREMEVLRLLPTRLTLREIGDQLFVSHNTVKSHVKAIYRKLECATRAEASERIRSSGRTLR